jgi:serine/threonine protein kinase
VSYSKGQRFGRYELIKILDRHGGESIPWRALDHKLEQDVCLKLIREELLPKEPERRKDYLIRFAQQAKIMASVRGDHIVQVLDDDTTDRGEPFIVTELLQGRSLRDLLAEEGWLDEARAAKLLTQALEGIERCHALKPPVIHRDIKPGNLFVEGSPPDERVKLLDFGIAKLPGLSITRTGFPLGTLCYASPEQLWDAKSADERSDVYGAGATLYHCLTGQCPFAEHEDKGEHRLFYICVHHEPPLRRPKEIKPSISPEMEAIILKAMAKEPGKRYQSAREFRLAFSLLDRTMHLEALDQNYELLQPWRAFSFNPKAGIVFDGLNTPQEDWTPPDPTDLLERDPYVVPYSISHHHDEHPLRDVEIETLPGERGLSIRKARKSPSNIAFGAWQRALHDLAAIPELEGIYTDSNNSDAHDVIGFALIEVYERHGETRKADKLMASLEKHAAPALRFGMSLRRAAFALDNGRSDRAEAALADADRLLDQLGLMGRPAVGLKHAKSRVALMRDLDKEAFDLLDDLRQKWKDLGDNTGEALAAAGQALVCWAQGRHEKAERWAMLSRMLSRTREQPDGAPWARSLFDTLTQGSERDDTVGRETKPIELDDVSSWLAEGDLDAQGINAWIEAHSDQDDQMEENFRMSLRSLGVRDGQLEDVDHLLRSAHRDVARKKESQ